eukprot:GHVU01008496.1.p1 GENE.GHVU01008496.1~~GHVU01008496.1.p1  ORF type:complete len:494 (-),score=7.92 GHVU01008496.1:155-1636(-)
MADTLVDTQVLRNLPPPAERSNFPRCARSTTQGFFAGQDAPHILFRPPPRFLCRHCNALKCEYERHQYTSCCSQGALNHRNVRIPVLPQEHQPGGLFRHLWEGTDPEARTFRRHARTLNNHFAFGQVEMHESELSRRNPETCHFTMQGECFVRQLPLLRSGNQARPCHSQLYVYDPMYDPDTAEFVRFQLPQPPAVASEHPNFEDFMATRSVLTLQLTRVSSVNERHLLLDIAKKVFLELLRCNRYVRDFVTVAEELSANPRPIPFTFIIPDRPNPASAGYDVPWAPAAQSRQYQPDHLSLNEVSVLRSGTTISDRDLLIHGRGSFNDTIPFRSVYYDLAKYPLLFVTGRGGWHESIVGTGNRKITLQKYYRFLFQDRPNDHSVIALGEHSYCVHSHILLLRLLLLLLLFLFLQLLLLFFLLLFLLLLLLQLLLFLHPLLSRLVSTFLFPTRLFSLPQTSPFPLLHSSSFYSLPLSPVVLILSVPMSFLQVKT